jgi:hypothetical protein
MDKYPFLFQVMSNFGFILCVFLFVFKPLQEIISKSLKHRPWWVRLGAWMGSWIVFWLIYTWIACLAGEIPLIHWPWDVVIQLTKGHALLLK